MSNVDYDANSDPVNAMTSPPEGDLVLPQHFEATEVYDMLGAQAVRFSVHRSDYEAVPRFLWGEEQFVGLTGLQRFLRYRDSRRA